MKAAQLMYLADNPSTPVANLTQALLLPYMPNGTWPTLPLVDNVAPTINCTVFPPVAFLVAQPTIRQDPNRWPMGRGAILSRKT